MTSNALSALNCLHSVSSVFVVLIFLAEQITKQFMEILTEHTQHLVGKKGITLFSAQRSNSAILDEVNSIFSMKMIQVIFAKGRITQLNMSK